MNHHNLSCNGIILESIVIKTESLENDFSSSAEYEDTESENGLIKSSLNGERKVKVHHDKNSGREARNRAEKNRRDKLNGSIQELSTMVPHVAESPRRVDKTAVLRYSAHGLRVQYVFANTINSPPKMKPQVTDALMRLLDSFMLTITCRGQIVLVSASVEQHLGHCQTDLFGQNILHITHPDDQNSLKSQIIPTDLESLFEVQAGCESDEPRPRTQLEENLIDQKLKQDKRTFIVRLARAGPRSEPTSYEVVKIDGCFRRADSAPRGLKANTFPSGLQLVRRARGREEPIPLHTISGNDIVLVAVAHVIKPLKVCDRLIEANHYEYKTRHLIDGRIIQCDQRISLVAGYMTDEVYGLSPFTFMHQDDVRWVIVALRQMYDCNSAYGESCYRLITRTGSFIYLRTRGYLEIDKDTNKVHSFLCINTLVNEDEGKRRVRDMKDKFSIIINTKVPPSAIDAPAAENPQQLERAIIYLIQNLQNPDERIDIESCKTNKKIKASSAENEVDSKKTTPFAIIAPKTCTIKSSITKSINVVSNTAAKGLIRQRKGNIGSPSSSDEGGRVENDNNTRPSVLQKNTTYVDTNKNQTNQSNDLRLMQGMSFEPTRVPPLPNSRGYFDTTTYSDNILGLEDITSPSSYSSSESNWRQTSSTKRSNLSDDYGDNESTDNKRRRLQLESEGYILPYIEELTNSSADLSQVLPSSFEAIDRSLLSIESATTELKDHCNSYQVAAKSQYQLNEIIEEQQEQREMLENIQNEFNAHLQNTGSNVAASGETESYQNKKDLTPR